MSVTTTRIATLDEALEQQIRLGLGDPLEIADAILGLYGEDEVLSWLDLRRIVADSARLRVGNLARKEEAQARRTSDPLAALRASRAPGRWVPGKGVVRFHEMTAEDAAAIAKHRRDLEIANAVAADFWESIAARLIATGVARIGELSDAALLERRALELGEAA